MEEVFEFLKQCQTYYLATVEGEQPRVRPFGSYAIYEGKLYIETAHYKRVAQQINAHPLVEICAFDNQSRWVRIACQLVPDERVEAKHAFLEQMPELRDLGYDEHGDKMAIYYMKDATATFESYAGEKREVQFNYDNCK